MSFYLLMVRSSMTNDFAWYTRFAQVLELTLDKHTKCPYNKSVQIEWDEAKRQTNLEKHGLDLADAFKIFDGSTWEFEDERFDYPETRVITVGF